MNKKETKVIWLTEEQKRLLIEETKEKYPMEACGLLFGKIIDEEAIVTKIVTTRNILNSTTNFKIDPEELVEALSEAEKEDIELIGFFHSHSTAPYPSTTDARNMKLWPDNIWLIVSVINYQIAAYRAVNSSIRKVKVELT